MTVNKWSTTADTNATADSSINFREGQSAPSLNNSARSMMAAIAKWRDDISGKTALGGTANAQTYSSSQGFASLTDGLTFKARVATANTSETVTLNVDSLGAKGVRVGGASSATKPHVGFLRVGSIYQFTYLLADDVWLVSSGGYVEVAEIASGTAMLFVQTAAPTGWTKSTTHNNKALRVVSGTASSGGSATFTATFASRTPDGTVGNTTLATADIPSHTHQVTVNGGNDDESISYDLGGDSKTFADNGNQTVTSGSAGGGTSHTHSFTGTAMDFAVAYVDVIIATRD